VGLDQAPSPVEHVQRPDPTATNLQITRHQPVRLLVAAAPFLVGHHPDDSGVFLLEQLREPLPELLEHALVAGDEPSGQERGDGVQSGACEDTGVLGGVRQMPHLETRIPQRPQHPTRQLGLSLSGMQEQQVDIGLTAMTLRPKPPVATTAVPFGTSPARVATASLRRRASASSAPSYQPVDAMRSRSVR
jgi:hypothetical protein